jgi:hypothetical protein
MYRYQMMCFDLGVRCYVRFGWGKWSKGSVFFNYFTYELKCKILMLQGCGLWLLWRQQPYLNMDRHDWLQKQLLTGPGLLLHWKECDCDHEIPRIRKAVKQNFWAFQGVPTFILPSRRKLALQFLEKGCVITLLSTENVGVLLFSQFCLKVGKMKA